MIEAHTQPVMDRPFADPSPAPKDPVAAALAQWTDEIRRGNLEGAEEALRGALATHPEDVRLLRNLSETHRRRGAVAEALTVAHKALALDGEDLETHNHLAAIHLQNLNLNAAKAATATVLGKRANHSGALLRMSDICLRQGDIDGAHRWADAAVTYHGKNPSSYLARAHAHLAVGELGYAETALGEAAALAPANEVIKQRLAYVRAASERHGS